MWRMPSDFFFKLPFVTSMETGQEPVVGKRSQLDGMLPQTDMLLGTHAAAADEWTLTGPSFGCLLPLSSSTLFISTAS